jgi:hypothetical protein
LILTADHGQVSTPRSAFSELRSHPTLGQHLHIKPSGENRLVYLHVKPGRVKAVREYVEDSWQGRFTVWSSHDLAQTELFGPGMAHADLDNRMGDLAMIPLENQYLWWAEKRNPLLGRHGGLHPEEMIVPFLATRLD